MPGCSSSAPWSANSGVQVVPISATSGTLPPAIAVTNLSCACAHGTNWILTVVPGFAASKSLPYWFTTPWIFGEPGSMIQTSIDPSSLALPPPEEAFDDGSSLPPHAATTVASSAATANPILPFISSLLLPLVPT